MAKHSKVTQSGGEKELDRPAREGDWSRVDLVAMKPLPSPVTLQEIKGEKSLAEISLIKQSRLSVMPIAPKEYERILGMGGI